MWACQPSLAAPLRPLPYTAPSSVPETPACLPIYLYDDVSFPKRIFWFHPMRPCFDVCFLTLNPVPVSSVSPGFLVLPTAPPFGPASLPPLRPVRLSALLIEMQARSKHTVSGEGGCGERTAWPTQKPALHGTAQRGGGFQKSHRVRETIRLPLTGELLSHPNSLSEASSHSLAARGSVLLSVHWRRAHFCGTQ